jgi:uncharacterized membrane protein
MDNSPGPAGHYRPNMPRAERPPVHRLFVPFPIVCFVGALATDVAYALTAEMMWADFSAWLLTFGMITGVLAAIAGVFDLIRSPWLRTRRSIWLYVIGSFVVLLLALINTLVHTRDAWTSVVPEGLILSAVVVVILCVMIWLGRSAAYQSTVRGIE